MVKSTPFPVQRVLLEITVFYITPGVSPTMVDNVISYSYETDPNRLVIHHDTDQETTIMTDNIRMVHVTVDTPH